MLKVAVSPSSCVVRRARLSLSRSSRSTTIFHAERRRVVAWNGRQCAAISTSAATTAAASPPAELASVSPPPVTSFYMWGKNDGGSVLITDPQVDATKPLTIPKAVDWKTALRISEGGPDIQKVVCGASDTAWIMSDGRCFVSGKNKQGQLGLGHTKSVTEPTELVLPNGVAIRDASGPNFGAYVDTNGDLFTCGFGGSTFSGMGQLGHGNGETYTTPKLVESLVEDNCFVSMVQVGDMHMTVLTTEGEVLTTGAGSYGRLGNFDTNDQLYLEPVEALTSGVTQIAGGKSFTLALKGEDGVVYGWGRNHKGQLGTGFGFSVDMYAMQAIPEPIESDELLGRKVTKIAAGHSHAAAITQGGELFYWGMTLHLEPVRVHELLHTPIVDVVCGEDYTLALDQEGRLYSWGKGKSGCLGRGDSVKVSHQPALMEAFGDLKVQTACAGWKHAACLVE